MRLSLILAGSLLACDDPTTDTHFVSPYDGQTDWPVAAPLQVHVGAPVAPDRAELDPDLVVVVDLDVGGRVDGSVLAEGSDLFFFPDEPFAAGHRFAWSVAAPHDEARQAHVRLPPSLTGSATFHTGPVAEPIAALRLDDDLCLMLSSDPAGAAWELGLSVRADGIPVALGNPVPVALSGIEPTTPGVASLACLELSVDAGSVDGIRVDADEQVWQLPVRSSSTDTTLAELHRLGDQGGTE